VDQRPGRQRHLLGIAGPQPAPADPLVDQIAHHRVGFPAGGIHRDRLRVGRIAGGGDPAEDGPEVGRVADGERDVADAAGAQAGQEIVRAASGDRGAHLGGQQAEPLLGDGRDQGVLVAEVAVGRRVADPRQLRRRAQAQPLDAQLRQQLEPGLDQGPPQIPVLVGVGPLARNPDAHDRTLAG